MSSTISGNLRTLTAVGPPLLFFTLALGLVIGTVITGRWSHPHRIAPAQLRSSIPLRPAFLAFVQVAKW